MIFIAFARKNGLLNGYLWRFLRFF